MIGEALLMPFIKLISLLISLIPALPSTALTFTNLILFIRKGLYFTNSTIFAYCISVVAIWLTLQLGWVIFEWIYKKIPGIN